MVEIGSGGQERMDDHFVGFTEMIEIGGGAKRRRQSMNSRGLTLNRSHNFRRWSTVSDRSPQRIFDPILG